MLDFEIYTTPNPYQKRPPAAAQTEPRVRAKATKAMPKPPAPVQPKRRKSAVVTAQARKRIDTIMSTEYAVKRPEEARALAFGSTMPAAEVIEVLAQLEANETVKEILASAAATGTIGVADNIARSGYSGRITPDPEATSEEQAALAKAIVDTASAAGAIR